MLELHAFSSASLRPVVARYTIERLNALTTGAGRADAPLAKPHNAGKDQFCEVCASVFLNNGDIRRHIVTINLNSSRILKSLSAQAASLLNLRKLGSSDALELVEHSSKLVNLLNRSMK
ncbi:hypothetical protein G5B40_17480 [Pikeienuella piscinae]|uniref:C2H2-type domain-containing protein n=1 Tax=Pikeienuella piscinae TaxID=2748098 RepID=A0A7L5BYS4_9RHOB|nr:hypothetical protein [Pikeienuella piscinae]QIE57075.1 hypothetical protein G5B40_17480 [Pikeienuella piscinae]